MKRLQRKRTKGWRKPEGSVIVDRTSRWGNPFRVGDTHPEHAVIMRKGWAPKTIRKIETVEEAVRCFRFYALGRLAEEPQWLDPLKGKNLLCFCKEGDPCHADVLIELANKEVEG